MRILIILLFSISLLTAAGCPFCNVRTFQGLYEGSAVEGWKRESSGGTYFYIPPTARGNGYPDYFKFTNPDEKRIVMSVSLVGRSVSIEGKEITVVRNDGKPMPPLTIRFKWNDRKYNVIAIE